MYTVVSNRSVSEFFEHCLQFIFGDSRIVQLGVLSGFFYEGFHCFVRESVIWFGVRLPCVYLLKISSEEIYFFVVESGRFTTELELVVDLSGGSFPLESVYRRPYALAVDLGCRECVEQLLEGGGRVICQGVSHQQSASIELGSKIVVVRVSFHFPIETVFLLDETKSHCRREYCLLSFELAWLWHSHLCGLHDAVGDERVVFDEVVDGIHFLRWFLA